MNAIVVKGSISNTGPLLDTNNMPVLEPGALTAYLETVFGTPVSGLRLAPLGQPVAGDVKQYGYGVPLLVDFEAGGIRRRAVLETMSPGPFGHEHQADRAQAQLWNHRSFNLLPRHVRSLDVGSFSIDNALLSLGRAREFFTLTEYVEGQGYFHDLQHLRDDGALTELDLDRADALCDYLVGIHQLRGPDPGLYTRRIRELVGHGECIMGIMDSYPPDYPGIPGELLESIELLAVAWRWRLKRRTHRLRQVHGDFHPWNILFRGGTDFTVLDRSRGEWGEPADDVAALVMNYLFSSLQRYGQLAGPFHTLFLGFWDRYLTATADKELLEVVAPFLAFRALVMASPVWYPHLAETVRAALLQFTIRVLEEDVFDPYLVNTYLEA